MKKMEVVFKSIADAAIEDRETLLMVREIATALSVSPNTVSIAIRQLLEIGCVKRRGRHFELIDLNKLLLFWAARRRLSADMVYSTYVPIKNVEEVESKMPSGIAYTGCSGYSHRFGNDVSDYSTVYLYATDQALKEIKRRFPPKRLSKKTGYANLIVLKPDRELLSKIMDNSLVKSSVSMAQLYADLWNSKEWYSYEFLKRIKTRIGEISGTAVLE